MAKRSGATASTSHSVAKSTRSGGMAATTPPEDPAEHTCSSACRWLQCDLTYVTGITKPKKRKVFLTEAQQAQLLAAYQAIKAGKSGAGTIAELCKRFGVDRTVPSKLFANAKMGMKPPASRKGVGGRTPRIGLEEAGRIQTVLREANYDLTFREIEERTGIPKSTVQRWWKEVALPAGWRTAGKRYIPLLSDAHRVSRLAYAKRWRQHKWFRHVEIDEKWFYATSTRRRLKLPPGVKAPKMPVVSKRYVPKVMVLTAIARPMVKYGFDGKVGCWRVAEPSVAVRNSKHRQAGDTVMKDITMDGDVFRAFIIEVRYRYRQYRNTVNTVIRYRRSTVSIP